MNFGLVKKGLLMLCQTEHVWHEEAKTAEQARALGLPAEVLDARQTAALDPSVRREIAGAVYYPQDCHFSPAAFMAALQMELERLGVQFRWQSQALVFKTKNGPFNGQRDNPWVRALALVDGQEIEADEFILCGGSWSPGLVQSLGLNIPIQAGKGYSLTLPQPRRLPQICSILTEARVAVTPMGETLRVGGTMELAGLNEAIRPARIRGIIESFCRYHPEFEPADFDGIQPWQGFRPCSPDGLPYLGRTAKFGNLSLATGHAMMGMSLGPITGKLMAEIIAGEKPALDLAMLSPDRYG
jgi:D-amino-acid dehydrogenase